VIKTISKKKKCKKAKWLSGEALQIAVKLNGLPWKQTDNSVIFEIALKYCI